MRTMLVALATLVAILLFRSNEQDTAPTVSGYASALATIADRLDAITVDRTADDEAWNYHARDELHALDENVREIEGLAQTLEGRTADSCTSRAPPLGPLIRQMAAISTAIDRITIALDTSIERRSTRLEAENTKLAWQGLRGTREHELNELYALAHEIEVTRASRDIALCRLQTAIEAYFDGRRCT